MPIDQMKQLLDSMETSVKLQHQARSQRRAEEAERDRKAFQEKLMRAENRTGRYGFQGKRTPGCHAAGSTYRNDDGWLLKPAIYVKFFFYPENDLLFGRLFLTGLLP